MSSSGYLRGQRMSRRSAIRSAGLVGAGLAGAALIGCGDSDEVAESSSSSSSSAATQAATQAAAAATQAATQAAAAATQAPSGGPKSGGIGIAQSATVYETFDAQRTVASPVLGITSHFQNKLLRFTNPDKGEVTGDLAESWEQTDPTTLVLHLRKGVKWHNDGPGSRHSAAAPGREFTSSDVLWNIERQQRGTLEDGSEASFGRNAYWGKIDSIDTPDDYTVQFNLNAVDATFIQGLANEYNYFNQPELMTAVEGKHTEIDAGNVIGTGPYILTEWIPGERVSAVKNPEYYMPGRPYLDGFVWIQNFTDPVAYRVAFEQKQVMSFTDPDPTVTLAMNANDPDNTNIKYSGVANTVACYTNTNLPFWNDNRITRAIDMSIDRRLIIQQLHGGLAKPSGPVTWIQDAWAIPQEELEVTPGYQSGAAREKDLVEANKLWQAAGGPDQGDIEWTIAKLWSDRASWAITPDLISDMFNSAFNTKQFKGVSKTYGEIIPSWFAKTFDPFFAWIPNIEIPDARADMYSAFHSSSAANIWSVNEPDKIDKPLEDSLAEFDYDTAYELVKGVQDFAMENGQFGRHIAYNYVVPGLRWNFLKGPYPEDPATNWSFLSGSLWAHNQWNDTDDPSWEGTSQPAPAAL
jgi:peptide/nickel transport system substrate-binding protein